MLEKSFLRNEESWLSPPEYDEHDEDEYICDRCGETVPQGSPFLRYNGHLWCESCANDKLNDSMEIA